jgi:hypothetical protein
LDGLTGGFSATLTKYPDAEELPRLSKVGAGRRRPSWIAVDIRNPLGGAVGASGGKGGASRAFAPDVTAMVAAPMDCAVEEFSLIAAAATDAATFFPAVRATGRLGFWGVGQVLAGASGGVGQLLTRGVTVRAEGIFVSTITRQAADATSAAFNSGVGSLEISGGAVGMAAAARASTPNHRPAPSAWYDIVLGTPAAVRNLSACQANLAH